MPALDSRTLGRLRYLYRKATTPDNWDREGEPHPHWDNITGQPMLSWHRSDPNLPGLPGISSRRWDGNVMHLAAHPRNSHVEGSQTRMRLTNVDSTEGWLMKRVDETVPLVGDDSHVAIEMTVDNQPLMIRRIAGQESCRCISTFMARHIRPANTRTSASTVIPAHPA